MLYASDETTLREKTFYSHGGGGVVGDLTGRGVTHLRGIDFIQLPTTLLVQVDSSVEEKRASISTSTKYGRCNCSSSRLVYMNGGNLKILNGEQSVPAAEKSENRSDPR